MAPEVIAAIIGTPSILIAATAAYAAGRAQGRGSVDAVRRQHQRDAYAQFLDVAYTFSTSSRWPTCVARAKQEAREAGQSPGASQICIRAAELRVGVSTGPLTLASIVITLEGPDHLTEVASELVRRALAVHDDAAQIGTSATEELALIVTSLPESRQSDRRFIAAMGAFSHVARLHLNGNRPPRDVWAAERD
ncbi:hypothetical protein [Streptomyces halstedii]|uniref:hypothetical protein n=1 Tax=Streptomyces halstedii TaxID=1944 RepID=UPI0036650623